MTLLSHLMDRDAQEKAVQEMIDRVTASQRALYDSMYTINQSYHLVLYRNFRKGRIYLRAMKGDAALGWQMTITADKAYRFNYPAHAAVAINEYCKKYHDDPKNFRIMKVTEEQVVVNAD